MNPVLENALIEQLTRTFRRSPLQLNGLQESDAELILIPGSETVVAITTDTIAEEIAVGLYNDPYLAGWMVVMVNMSDLAAVGAKPIGMLVSELLPRRHTPEWLGRLQKGINDACTTCNTYLLGGDTNTGDQFLLTGTAVGVLPDNKILTRKGMQPGDILYTTGRLGRGNSFALQKHVRTCTPSTYLPQARIHEAQIIRRYATACMDTSDGTLATLDQLTRMNSWGMQLADDWDTLLDADAKACIEAAGLPSWLLLAGQHGEFELMFTLPETAEADLVDKAMNAGWRPLRLGTVIKESKLLIPLYGTDVTIDATRLRNLAFEMNGDVEAYIKNLVAMDREIRKGEFHHDS